MAGAADADHELWAFDPDELMRAMERQAGELADMGIEANERLKATINADIIALALFMKSAHQSVQQVRLLGIAGQAYHKIGKNGVKYIIFKGYAGLRPHLPGPRYLATNPKVACFVVGSREIIADATKATKIAVIVLVAIDIIRELREDHFSLASLGVRVLSDVLQAAGAAAIGAAAGIFAMTLGAPAVAAFVVVVGAGFLAG